MKPNFCVITTTYKRPESVLKSLESLETQTYSNWSLIIVVDDIKSDYSLLESKVNNNPKITCLKNAENIGKNASVNRAFSLLQAKNFNGYLVFLDDDDWLAPDCLRDFANEIEKNSEKNWLVSQRVNIFNKEPLTKNNTGRSKISYLKDVLLTHKFTGDTTHCLNFSKIRHVFFPTYIKNAEEWIYFSHLAKIYSTFTYLPKAGTYSEGYSEAGLTDNYHRRKEKRGNRLLILKEVWQRKLFSPYILIYICGWMIRSLR